MKLQWSGALPESRLEIFGEPNGGVHLVHDTPDGFVVVLGTTAFLEEFRLRIAAALGVSSDTIAGWLLDAPGSLICFSRRKGGDPGICRLRRMLPHILQDSERGEYLAERPSQGARYCRRMH
jgi:hypothetical protein